MADQAYKKFVNLARSGLGQIMLVDYVSRNPQQDAYTIYLKHFQGKKGAARLTVADDGRPYINLPGDYFDRNRIQRGRIDKGLKVFIDVAHGFYLLNDYHYSRLEQNYQRLSVSLERPAEKPAEKEKPPAQEPEKTIIGPDLEVKKKPEVKPAEEKKPPAKRPKVKEPEETAPPSKEGKAPPPIPEKEAKQIVLSFNPRECTEWDVRLFFRAITPRPPKNVDKAVLDKTRELKNNPEFGKLFANIPRSEFSNAYYTLDVVDIDDFSASLDRENFQELRREAQYFINMIAGRLFQQFSLQEANRVLEAKILPIRNRIEKLCRQSKKLSASNRKSARNQTVQYVEKLRQICVDFVFKTPEEMELDQQHRQE